MVSVDTPPPEPVDEEPAVAATTAPPSVTPVVETVTPSPSPTPTPTAELHAEPDPDRHADPDADLIAEPDACAVAVAVAPAHRDPLGSRHRVAHSGGLRRSVMSDVADTFRARAARVVVLVVAAACLVGVAPPAADAGARDDAPRRWVGYPIPANGDAAGGWIGGYRVGGTKLFLTTPTRNPNRAGYAIAAGDRRRARTHRVEGRDRAGRVDPLEVRRLPGRHPGSRGRCDRSITCWSAESGEINRPRGKRRIRQSGNRAAVARFARIMLRQSKESAGPYSASLTASATDVGGTVAVTLSVTDGHGRAAGRAPGHAGDVGGCAGHRRDRRRRSRRGQVRGAARAAGRT